MAKKKPLNPDSPFNLNKASSFSNDKKFNGVNEKKKTAITIGVGPIVYAQQTLKSKRSLSQNLK